MAATAANIKTRATGKLRFALFPLVVLVEVVKVMMFGAVKYEPNNWQEATDPREPYYDALWRHIGAWWSGEETVDSETGISHLAHGIACLSILLWHAFKRGEVAPANLADVMQRAEKARAERLAREATAASTPANDTDSETDPLELARRRAVGCACTHAGLCSASRGCACGRLGFYKPPTSAPAAL